ncbi:hypothetical protein HYC85_014110 [Camellia sinensis]|uniref:ASCH domain-containing protein n=1 Tax=Camellia sinensis TaxID=4442 RepID=A0A7J7H5B0_CAMSI|nr:hypothetical protein HYC85_014110 [Camellia sinensis]
MERRNNGMYRNQCLTMHQPWASLLVHGIKRIEGRSWPAPIRAYVESAISLLCGKSCILKAVFGSMLLVRFQNDATIKAMEDFYREIYAVNGITDLKFPQHYPVSRLLGCIEVVGCLRCEELACWKEVPEGLQVRLEGLTNFCWLCEEPQVGGFVLLNWLSQWRCAGYHGVYNLERKIYEAAVGGLVPVESPLPVKFQLPNPRDPFSLKPGSISVCFPDSKASEVEKSSSLNAAIAGACAAASQYSKKGQNLETNAFKNRHVVEHFTRPRQLNSNSLVVHKMAADEVGTLVCHNNEPSSHSEHEGTSNSHKQFSHAKLSHHPGPSSKVCNLFSSVIVNSYDLSKNFLTVCLDQVICGLGTDLSTEKGRGLGVLVTFNRALLGKWLWRFAWEPKQLWRRVVVGKYGLVRGDWGSGDVIGSHGCGLWKGIWLERVEFWDRVGFRMGYGMREAMVASYLGGGDVVVWDIHLRRSIQDWEVDQLELWGIYIGWVGVLVGEVERDFPWKSIWVSGVPSKISFFMWTVVLAAEGDGYVVELVWSSGRSLSATFVVIIASFFDVASLIFAAAVKGLRPA